MRTIVSFGGQLIRIEDIRTRRDRRSAVAEQPSEPVSEPEPLHEPSIAAPEPGRPSSSRRRRTPPGAP